MFGENDYTVYTVKSGDTLDKIAKKHGTTYQEIAKVNMIADPNKIEVGQQLMIYTMPVATTKMSLPKVSIALPKIKAPDLSNNIVNYVLMGGIVLLGLPLAEKLYRMRTQ